jgi:hypothetical protein
MLVLTFDPEEFNFIRAGEASYFLLRFADGSLVLYKDCCDQCLVCPWHRSKYAEKVLRKQAKPLIQRSGRVTAVLDMDQSTPISLVKKAILAATT